MAKDKVLARGSGRIPEEVWRDIKNKTEGINYGSVVITVHDGMITQIEVSSKIRY